MHLGISTIIIWTDNLYYSVDYAHVTNKPRWYFKNVFISSHTSISKDSLFPRVV